jgi:hypothetical protein
MPLTQVFFYQDADGHVPVIRWLEDLQRKDLKAFEKCTAVIERLEEAGYELRRPTADLLRDGIYELRTRKGHVNYRILYFFHGRNVAILAHAMTKEDVIPRADLDRALERKRRFEGDPDLHVFKE